MKKRRRKVPHRDPGGDSPLPEANVEVLFSGDGGEVTPAQVRAMFCNPLYAGMGAFPKIVDDETWVRSAARMIREEGAEQFLVNMLHTLRQTLASDTPEPDDE